jgi:hypothetical protein
VGCPGGPFGLDDGTDAVLAITWNELDEIRDPFGRSLNPYQEGAIRDIMKLEDEKLRAVPDREGASPRR